MIAEREGYRAFHRPPYKPRRPVPREIAVPPPPEQPDNSFFGVLARWTPGLIALLMLGATVYFATLGATFAGNSSQIVVLTGIASMGALIGQAGVYANTRRARQKLTRYIADLYSLKDRLSLENKRFVTLLQTLDPAPPLLKTVVDGGRGPYLWERRPEHADSFLCVRIGQSPSRSSAVRLQMPALRTGPDATQVDEVLVSLRAALEHVTDAPGVVNLREAEVFSIVGPRTAATELAYAVLCQIAVHHSPEDVRLMLFFSPSRAQEWFWAGWLPHSQPFDPDANRPMLAGNAQETGRLADALKEIMTRRQEKGQSADDGRGRLRHPYIIVVLDETGDLPLDAAFVRRLMRDGPAQNILTIVLTDRNAGSGEALSSVTLTDAKRMDVVLGRRDGGGNVVHWTPDRLSKTDADALARSLAPLQLEQERAAFLLPASVPFFTVLGWHDISDERVAKTWALASRTSLEATLGVSETGQPMRINLDESIHGTHGVLVGASGAGKSVLLQALITSLALHNHPSRLNFVLADLKGGATFRAFAPLPHTVGIVTNQFDEFSLSRFLVSIRKELSRRQVLIDAAQARFGPRVAKLRDLEEYAPDDAFPYLLVIIDEFAELARSVPEMMNELVVIAQQGRSLGVFLLLSMQTTETLKGAIERNVRYRIALRMKSKADSKEVIGDDVAATISGRTPGRGYFRCDDDLVLFQTAGLLTRTLEGATYAQPATATSAAIVVQPIDPQWHMPPAAPPSTPTHTSGGRTDLELAVSACHDALDITPLAQPLHLPWRPPLPDTLTLDDVLPTLFRDGHFCGWSKTQAWLTIPLALLDIYWTQSQPLLMSAFADGRHIQFLGVQESGRTPALLSAVLALAATHTPTDMSFIFIDFGSTLTLFERLPHATDHYSTGQFEGIAACLKDLVALVDERRRLFASLPDGGSARTIEEYRAYQHRNGVPQAAQVEAVVLVIDNYTAWAQTQPDFRYDHLPQIKYVVQNGAAYGIYVILTADRPVDVANGDLSANFQSILLRMDVGDVATVVNPYDKRILAAWQNRKGRGIIRNEEAYNVIELQCLTPFAVSDAQQIAAIQRCVAEIAAYPDPHQVIST